MPTEKISDDTIAPWGGNVRPCLNREHEPPKHRVYEPGTYRHTCPGCGAVTTFTIQRPIW